VGGGAPMQAPMKPKTARHGLASADVVLIATIARSLGSAEMVCERCKFKRACRAIAEVLSMERGSAGLAGGAGR
jgi:hypothetical protein